MYHLSNGHIHDSKYQQFNIKERSSTLLLTGHSGMLGIPESAGARTFPAAVPR